MNGVVLQLDSYNNYYQLQKQKNCFFFFKLNELNIDSIDEQ